VLPEFRKVRGNQEEVNGLVTWEVTLSSSGLELVIRY